MLHNSILSFDCTPSHTEQSKERKGSNFAIYSNTDLDWSIDSFELSEFVKREREWRCQQQAEQWECICSCAAPVIFVFLGRRRDGRHHHGLQRQRCVVLVACVLDFRHLFGTFNSRISQEMQENTWARLRESSTYQGASHAT